MKYLKTKQELSRLKDGALHQTHRQMRPTTLPQCIHWW